MTSTDTSGLSRYECRMAQNTIDAKVVRENVRRLCQARGLTLEQLAERADLSSVKMIMQRGSGRMASIKAMASALGVSVDDLLTKGSHPRTKELIEFLESPMAKDVSEDEQEKLQALTIQGRRMTPAAYHMALMMIRATEPEDS